MVQCLIFQERRKRFPLKWKVERLKLMRLMLLGLYTVFLLKCTSFTNELKFSSSLKPNFFTTKTSSLLVSFFWKPSNYNWKNRFNNFLNISINGILKTKSHKNSTRLGRVSQINPNITKGEKRTSNNSLKLLSLTEFLWSNLKKESPAAYSNKSLIICSLLKIINDDSWNKLNWFFYFYFFSFLIFLINPLLHN